MKHKGIIKSLCHELSQGYGINEALAELGLTPDYVAKRCRRIDRVRLHQAHMLYVEGLQREVVQRARLGRRVVKKLGRALGASLVWSESTAAGQVVPGSSDLLRPVEDGANS